MTVKNAFVDAAKDCMAILHFASPMAYSLKPVDLHKPGVDMMQAILHAVKLNKSIKRLIWTGSLIGNLATVDEANRSHPRNVCIAEGRLDNVAVWTGDTDAGEHHVEDLHDAPWKWYGWSKAAIRNILKQYATSLAHSNSARELKIIYLIPGWVLGRDKRAGSQEEALSWLSTNGLLRHIFKGEDMFYAINLGVGVPVEQDVPLWGTPVHIKDVATAHVKALTVPINGRIAEYILISDGPHRCVWSDAVNIALKNFPELENVLDPEGYFGTQKVYFDASKAGKEVLGRSFIPYEEQIVNFLTWFKSLPAKNGRTSET